MTPFDPRFFPVLFLFAFALFWLAIVTLLGLLSGWFRLAALYPDRDDEVLARFRWQSGVMGLGVNMGGILTLTACRSGLRVAISRMFGVFQRPFFVPWSDVSFEPDQAMFFPRMKLRFGDPPVGQLKISRDLGARLASAAAERWPAAAQAERPSRRRAALAIVAEGVIGTALAATFFILAPRFDGDPHSAPPIVVMALPAAVVGIATLVRLAIRFSARD